MKTVEINDKNRCIQVVKASLYLSKLKIGLFTKFENQELTILKAHDIGLGEIQWIPNQRYKFKS